MKWQMLTVKQSMTLQDTIACIHKNPAQIALVVDSDGRLEGTITDGDVRRALLKGCSLESNVAQVMNSQPITLPEDVSDELIYAVMQKKNIRHIPLIDRQGRVHALVSSAEFFAPKAKENWVVIMAGGLGSRLMPLTADTPKPMLALGEKPILLRIIESLIASHFSKLYISVNYCADVIEDFFGDGSRFGVEIRYLKENQRLGTAGSLALLEEIPEKPFIVMNGDVLTKVRFDNLLQFHHESDSEATICVRSHEMQVPFGVVETDGTSIKAICEKPIYNWLINAGIYVLSPNSLSMISKNSYLDMTTLMQQMLNQNKKLASFPIHEYWIDIGQHADFNRAQLDIHTLGS